MLECAALDDGWRDERLGDFDRVKHLLWNGHAREADGAFGWIEADVHAECDEAKADRRPKFKELGIAVCEFQI